MLPTWSWRLAPLAQRFRGFKPPRFLSLFEALVNGITCQQLSLTVGIILLNRLVQHHGRELGCGHAFPEPCDLKFADPEQLVRLGYSHNKGRALIELSQAISERRFEPNSLEQASDRDALVSLQRLRGIGRWTAEYALLRGLGRTNVFPCDDVGARNNLEQWLGLRNPLTYHQQICLHTLHRSTHCARHVARLNQDLRMSTRRALQPFYFALRFLHDSTMVFVRIVFFARRFESGLNLYQERLRPTRTLSAKPIREAFHSPAQHQRHTGQRWN